MTKMLSLISSVVLLLLVSAAAADSLRCGTQLVSRGDLDIQVREKCGEPDHQKVIGYTLKGRRHYHLVREREYAIEQWVYGPRRGYYQEVIFEAGRVVRINQIRQ